MYEVDKDLMLKVINYMAQHPYIEVYQLLNALTALKAKPEVPALVEKEEG